MENNLIVIENGQLNIYLLDNQVVWEVGRMSKEYTPDIPMHATTISRRHARLEYKGNDFYLTDLHSSNGTFINGELISPMKPFQIHSGDDVIFSDLEFTFEIVEGTQ